MPLDEPRQPLAEQFLETLMLIHINFFRAKQLPLPLNQYGVLMIAYTESAPTASDVCNILKISKQQMSSITERLVQAGLLQKVQDPADRRRSILRLTEAGLRIVRQQDDAVREEFAARLHNLSPEEQQALAGSLRSFNCLIDKMFNPA